MEVRISPVPREARPYQGASAGLVTRLVANTVDALSVTVALLLGYVGFNAVLFLIDPRGFEFATASALFSVTTALLTLVAYMTVAWSITGRTYGDHVMGLRVVGRRGDRVWFPIALVRAALCVGFPIGLLWCGVSSSRRSIQDVVLRTAVIYDWRPRREHEDIAVVA
jgi:uncharacterized RDD family membrane protein YckC